MGRIYTGLTKGLDVSVYAKPAFDDEQMAEIMLGLSEGLDVSTYAKPEYKWNIMRVMRLELRGK